MFELIYSLPAKVSAWVFYFKLYELISYDPGPGVY